MSKNQSGDVAERRDRLVKTLPLTWEGVKHSFFIGCLPGLLLPFVIWYLFSSPQNFDIVKLSLVTSISSSDNTEWRMRDELGVRQVISAVTADGQRYSLLTPAQVRLALRPKWGAVAFFELSLWLGPVSAFGGFGLAWFFTKRGELKRREVQGHQPISAVKQEMTENTVLSGRGVSVRTQQVRGTRPAVADSPFDPNMAFRHTTAPASESVKVPAVVKEVRFTAQEVKPETPGQGKIPVVVSPQKNPSLPESVQVAAKASEAESGTVAEKPANVSSAQKSTFPKPAKLVQPGPGAQQAELFPPDAVVAQPIPIAPVVSSEVKLDLGELYKGIDWRTPDKSIPNYFDGEAL